MYKFIEGGERKMPQVFRISDETYIPIDAQNTDYQQYLKWLEEGNTPEPADQGEQA